MSECKLRPSLELLAQIVRKLNKFMYLIASGYVVASLLLLIVNKQTALAWKVRMTFFMDHMVTQNDKLTLVVKGGVPRGGPTYISIHDGCKYDTTMVPNNTNCVVLGP